MTTVRFIDPPGKAEVPPGTTVLQSARRAGAPVASTCGGSCSCSGCHVVVHVGADLLSPIDDDEETILTTAFSPRPGSRLACQATVERPGQVLVEVTPESRRAFEEQHARTG